jgi:hypothetical protein
MRQLLRAALTRTRSLPALTVALVPVLLGCALRVWRLTDRSVCCDELNSLAFAKRPLGELMAALATAEPHPPFYYALLHFWIPLTGESELALRYPSVLFGTFAVACVYRGGRDLGGSRVGLASGLLLAINQYSLLQSQDTRMYAALQAWGALLLVGVIRYVRCPGRRSGAIVIAGGTLAALTHYHGMLAAGLGGIAIGALAPRREAAARLVPFLVIAGLCLPWVIFARQIFASYRGWMDLVGPVSIVSRTIESYGFSVPGRLELLARWTLPVLALLGAWTLGASGRWRQALAVASIGVLPLILVMGGALVGRPLYHERYLIVITPAFLTLAGAGLALFGRARVVDAFAWSGAAALGIAGVVAYYAPATSTNPDFRSTVALIEREAVAPAIVLMSPPQGPNIDYYLQDRLPSYTPPGSASAQDVALDLSRRAAGNREAWFVRYSSGDWDAPIGRWLEANAFYLRDQWVTQNHVVAYALALSNDIVESNVAFPVAGGFTITGVQVGPATARPDEPFLAGLSWQPSNGGGQPPTLAAKVSFRLIDPWGQPVATVDRRLVNPGELPGRDVPAIVQAALPVPSDAVPGSYRLEARFYDEASQKEWVVRDDAGREQPALALGRVTVQPAVSRPSSAAPVNPADPGVGSGLFVDGLKLAGGPYTSGATLGASFDWVSTVAQSSAIIPEIALRSAAGQVVASARREEAEQPYRLSQLRAGERVREHLDLPLRAVTSGGTYAVVLRLAADRPWVQVGSVDVAVDPTRYQRPPAASERSDLFDGAIRLIGLDAPPDPVRAGDSLVVRLVWHADRLPTAQYTVFVHLVGAGSEKPVAQSDGVPDSGKRPTLDWALGEYVDDEHTIMLPATLPPGRYRLLAGLYQGDTGRRADVVSSTADGQAVELGTVTVTSP